MEINSEIIEMINVQWSVEDTDYPYCDTFIFTKEEFEALTPEELEQMKIDKYNDWKQYIINPNI